MPLPVWLPIWLTNLLGTGWLRGLLGIRKDLIDTKKSKLEVRKLEHEERTRISLITPATFDDVKKYDPKYRKIEMQSHPDDIYLPKPAAPLRWRVMNPVYWLIILGIICLIISVALWLLR